MKVVSIPRLELCAAVLLARLMRLLINALSPRVKVDRILAFSNSEVVLHFPFIQSDKTTTAEIGLALSTVEYNFGFNAMNTW
uniref:Putative bel12 ag transposon polyprotein n=1 Tax=Panstrongylus lignarius TaxID=156445 RepID=A0A224XSM9_9HEMI